ncbi:neuraminidase-like domain-containing protein [Frankia sp. CiP3]|uniref:Tc toxin subunit A-related protein n=1 Tax=Frankia sp. CiP3 TaxID=2880971 RepID=UPI001EF4586B|nr:neuraminidase-like domain-containing protein [Frankia sp. CiP3]
MNAAGADTSAEDGGRPPVAELMIGDIARTLPNPPSLDVLARLAEAGVTTSTDLLAGQVRRDFDGLSDVDAATLGDLVAHAALATLDPAPPLRARLVEAGLRTPADVADISRERLGALVGADLESQAARVHAAATAQVIVLDSLRTAERVEGLAQPRTAAHLSSASTSSAAARSTLQAEQDCGCDDCRAATSPLAFLADLMKYATGRLRDAGGPMTVDGLARLLLQPLGELPVDCSSSEDAVSQVRLCVESLERLYREQLRAAPDVGVGPYSHGISFVVAADVDGDRQKELVIGFDETWLSPGEPVRSGIWVMRFDRATSRWRHLRPAADPRAAALLLPAGMHATSGFAARLRADTAPLRADREQVVIEVGQDGGPGGRYWVLQYEPDAASAAEAWTHLAPTVFNGFGADLVFPLGTLTGAFAADVDGDGLDEVVGYGLAPPAAPGGPDRPDAFWVYDFDNGNWASLAAPGSVDDVAFVCVDPQSFGPRPVRVVTAGDVDLDGRQEIVALPDAPGNFGKNPWVMRYGGVPGQWAHLNPTAGLDLNADLLASPAAGTSAHVLVGSVASRNRPDVLVGQGEWPGADLNQFTVFRYQPPTGGADADFVVQGVADGSAQPLPADLAVLADVDGDGLDELVMLTHLGRNDRRDACWVLKRDAAGTWNHLSPVPGHLLDADLEWSPGGGWRAWTVFGADIDGDGQDELIFAGNDTAQIWVMKYSTDDGTWRHVSPVLPDESVARYAFAAYRALLLQLGTSYDELREARAATAADRRALADRLGVRLGDTRPDTLDDLLLDPDTAGMDRLEMLFGLASTRRDPLTDGQASGPGAEQVVRWRLAGVRWAADPVSSPVAPDGTVHLAVARLDPTRVVVTAYRDAARTSPVAMGEGDPARPLQLHELSGSGLSGTVELAFRQNVDGTVLRVFPTVAIHRWERLRDLWDAEDHPDDPYRPGPAAVGGSPRRPLINPALIGPDDFRLPVTKASAGDPDTAFDIWLRRRGWLDGLLNDMRAIGDDIDRLLGSMRAAAGQPVDGHPWHAAPVDLDGLVTQLTAGTPTTVRTATATVEDRLFLPVDAFLRLMALRTRITGITAGGTPNPAEWAEARSILALAHLRFRFDIWREEERAGGIHLDAASFITVAPTPAEGDWPPELLPAEQLVGQQQPPMVDPDRLALSDLPTSVAGDEARALWHHRVTELDANATAVLAARAGGWARQLTTAFGTVPTGLPPWPQWIAARAGDLDSAAPVTVAAAVEAIRDRAGGMGVPAFRRLAAVNTVLADGRTPPESARVDAERLLVAARKVNVLYPIWRAEENAPARPLPYWRARRLALTRWLANQEDRQAWIAALAARCRAPAVDPDLVSIAQIRTGEIPGLASDAEKLRTARAADLYRRDQALRAVLAGTPGDTPATRVDAALLTGLWTDAERVAARADLAARRQPGAAGQPITAARQVVRQVFGDDADRFDGLRAALDVGGAGADDARRVVLGELGFTTETGFRTLTDVLGRDPADPTAVTPQEWAAFDRLLADACLLRWLVRAEHTADVLGLRLADRLAPLRLGLAAWRRLLAIRRIADAGGPILDSETDDLVAILLRTEKERLFGRWQEAEQGSSATAPIRLGPDSFSPDDAWTVLEPRAWRVTPAELRRWRETLRARTEQHDQVLPALRDAVARVEEAALPAYRDDLLAALPLPVAIGAWSGADPAGTYSDFAAGTRWASDHLLVDTAESGVRRTTRAAHAIDTMLTLLWSVRTGQLADTYPQLVLDAPTFDEDWRWIGSYATWRSAMLVHLYPENLLRPTLRRYQSPALRAALDELRAARQLTPTQARRVAARYADYFRDVCSLDLAVGRFACAQTDYPTRPAGHDVSGAVGRCEFVFAASAGSGRVYWCVRDAAASAAESHQSFWEELTALPQPVLSLVGATHYQGIPSPAGRRGWVYLFALVPAAAGGRRLVYTRRALDGSRWEDAEELETPSGTEPYFALLLAGSSSTPPAVGFDFPGRPANDPRGQRFVARMDPDGTRWDGDGVVTARTAPGWDSLVTHNATKTPRALLAGDVDGDGYDELVVVPAGVGPIEVFDLIRDPHAPAGRRYTVKSAGTLATEVEETSMVCVADVDGDSVAEIVWTLGARPDVDGRTTAVMIRKLDLGDNRWKPLAASDVEGSSVRCAAHINAFAEFLTPANLDGSGGIELVLGGRAHSDVLPAGGETRPIVNSGPSCWIVRHAAGAFTAAPEVFRPHPDYDYRYLVYERDLLRLAFRASPTQIMIAHLAAADFDGDGRSEILIFPTARRGDPNDDSSVANDFWVWDLRAADGRLAPLGPVAGNEWATVGDLSGSNIPVGAVLTADVDGDGRHEVVAFPFSTAEGTGGQLWVADYLPGGQADPAVGGGWVLLPGIDLSAEGSRPAFAAAGDFDGDGRDELLIFGKGRSWGRKFDPTTRAWTVLPALPDNGPLASVGLTVTGQFTDAPGTQVIAVPGTVSAPEPAPVAYTWGTQEPAYGVTRRYEFAAAGPALTLLQFTPAAEFVAKPACTVAPLIPAHGGGGVAWRLDDTADLRLRRRTTAVAFDRNGDERVGMRVYLWEAFYDLPLAIALALQEAHDYEHALDWFRLVYDYRQSRADRKVFYGLVLDEQGINEEASADPAGYARKLLDWVRDPRDPHATAATRPHTYTRGTLQLLIRCLLDYADAEFTRDTAESLERARVLYDTAHDLLAEPVLRQRLGGCEDTGGTALGNVVQPPVSLGAAFRRVGDDRNSSQLSVLASPGVAAVLTRLAAAADLPPLPHALAAPAPAFCVSPNPILAALRLHAELNLFKIQNGRNIAGLRRTVDAYAAPTDQTSGLPMIGADGELVLPGLRAAGPTPYRYQTLVEQARALAGQARDAEAMMLAALEKRDAEALNLLRARQEVRVARAGLRLQDLRVNQAEDRVTLAQLQQQRAAFEEEHYRDLLSAGQLEYEKEALGWLEAASRWQMAAALVHQSLAIARGLRASAYYYWRLYPQATDMTLAATEDTADALSGFASNASTWSQWNSMQAGFARTRQDWTFRQQIARYEGNIAGQQVTIETDGVRVAEQERAVSELQADNAEQLLEFQQSKFTNVELYDWMSGVLERTYRWFLQQATSLAQLAAQQLAFERQEGQPPAIQADYWEPPPQGFAALTGEGTGPDRRGLTGAARLLQDIADLEQYAFQTNQRKLQLTRTLSLAQLDPLELARLRTDGIMTFATPMRLFDQDFPGHHLRLIRRVAVSVVALIPPSEGIHATLSSTGVSRVVVGPEVFQTIVLRRPPESVALTAPMNATGTFTFEQPTGMRDPFEGLGVDTTWELRLPKASNLFDFATIADVLLTVDYTALDSVDYRSQVVRELDRTRDGERGFSLRQEFPDAWWDLTNPEAVDTPMRVSFTTRRADFPPNLDELVVEHVAVSLITESAPPAPLSTVTLRYTEAGTSAHLGGPGALVDRLVSTRRANGGPWLSITGKSPLGRWELGLPDTEDVRAWLAAGQLIDILLVVSYRAQTPAWPA